MISQQIEKRFNKNYTYIFMIKYPQEKIGIKGNSYFNKRSKSKIHRKHHTQWRRSDIRQCLLSLFVGILANAYVRFSIIIITATIIRICENQTGSDKTANIANCMLILEECR